MINGLNALKFIFGLLLLPLVACAHGPSFGTVAAQTKGKKVAIVSLSVADSSGALQGWNSGDVDEVFTQEVNSMLEIAEERLSERWEVIPAQQFVGNPEYKSLAGPGVKAVVPTVDGHELAVMAEDSTEMQKTRLAAQKAIEVSRVTGADLVVVIHCEWSVTTGSFVPTSKAIAVTAVGIFDATGKQRYHKYKIMRGSRALGAFGKVAVNEGTVDEWVDAFDRGLTALVQEK